MGSLGWGEACTLLANDGRTARGGRVTPTGFRVGWNQSASVSLSARSGAFAGVTALAAGDRLRE